MSHEKNTISNIYMYVFVTLHFHWRSSIHVAPIVVVVFQTAHEYGVYVSNAVVLRTGRRRLQTNALRERKGLLVYKYAWRSCRVVSIGCCWHFETGN